MILELYVTFLALSLTLLIIAYWKEKPILQILSYAILFATGLIMMNLSLPFTGTPGIQYKTGENTTYTYNGTDITATAQVNTYTTYTNHTYGFLISAAAALLIFLLLFDPKVKYQ